MDFYHAPRSSSQATQIMLHEAGIDFRRHKVDILSHTLEDGSEYSRINPNGYVPALVLDEGTLLTENVAILDWLSGRAAALPPGNELARTRHLQMLAFLSSELHKPFTPLFFIEDEDERASIRQLLERRLGWIATRVQRDYLFGDRFTGADALLYVMLRWGGMVGVAYPAALGTFIAHVERRGSVRTLLADEGIEPLRPVSTYL
ncbi:MAG TPA: glutathione S-transferase N-terminal domain-containing protein [Devosiaceae bacterium]|jgi:glutathione S-transferase|nr:glutathione S-transferase N-terminal domain-containing protein [Devosiaceae bacterium]